MRNYASIILLLTVLLFFIQACSPTPNLDDTTNTSVKSDITISHLRCEYLSNPEGLDVLKPRLSWVLNSETRGQRQRGFQVLVSSSEKYLAEDFGDLWDSGKVESGQSVQLEYEGKEPEPGQQCFWKVRVWDKDSKVTEWSSPAKWSMGLLDSTDWKAKWIMRKDSSAESLYPLPIFRKAFDVRGGIKNAKVYVSGLGHYELFLNGEKVGLNFLEPCWSAYEKTVYYNTYDITNLLRTGRNALGVMLGKGFYNTKGDRRIHYVDANRPLKLILQAHITYDDESEQVILSDSSWKENDGPITHSAILGGSDFDARLLPENWNMPSFDDSSWQYAEETTGPGGMLTSSPAPPMRTIQEFKAKAIDEPQVGYYVYDFGQNVSAKPRLIIQGKAGQTIRLTPAEQRHGQTGNANNGTGRVNQAGVGHPNYWEYTLKGDSDEVWSPQFTYSGYQYIEVKGAVPEGEPNPDNLPMIKELVSVQVRNVSASAGSFQCSNALFNDTNRLIDWAVQSNMSHVFTDCPHREKLGWLEESYLMGPSISWNYDVAAFYTKIVRDIKDSQDSDGGIYTVAPNYPRFQGGFRYSPEWGAAGVFVPWHLYQWYGDKRILEQNYSVMKKFVDYMHTTSDNLIARPGLGDWFDYGHGKSLGASRYTPLTLTATATFYGCCRIVSDTAKVLGRTKDHRKYSSLCENIKTAFNDKFFNGKATYENYGSCQTANSMAIALGLVEENHKQAVLDSIISDLVKRNYQQTAGDIGYHFLIETLEDNGHSDIIYKIANRNDVGSYGYIINQGWTSMPEAWDATASASMNHFMLGHIQQWFFEGLGGISPASEGFAKIKIRPEFVSDVNWCSCDYESIYGTIKSHWQSNEKGIELFVEIPVNTSAFIYLPDETTGTLYESDKPIDLAEGVRFLRHEHDKLVYEVQSGEYRFLIKKED